MGGADVTENEPKDDLRRSTNAQEARAMAHLAALEEAGRFGIVSWTDTDIITALENAGADPTPEKIAAVRRHVYVQRIADEMTHTGWRCIEQTICELGLLPLNALDKEGN
jgi:hypothetical protein